MTVTFDVTAARAAFPALSGEQIYMDNAGEYLDGIASVIQGGSAAPQWESFSFGGGGAGFSC